MTENELKNRQMALYRRYKATGCRIAHAELVDTLSGLVYKMSAQALPSGVSRDDLVSEGFAAVCESIELFHPTRKQGTSLSGLAFYRIRNALDVLTETMSRAVNAPRSRSEKNLRLHLRRYMREYINSGYSETVAIELSAKRIGVSVEHASSNLAIRGSVPLNSQEDERESRQFAQDAPEIEDAMDAARLHSALEMALSKLDDRECRVIEARLRDKNKVALDTLAEEFGVGRRRINQIFADALEHIRVELKIAGFDAENIFSE
jgi:RNA polymerase sigma-32 factor